MELSELVQGSETTTPEVKGSTVSFDVRNGDTVELDKSDISIGFFAVGLTTSTVKTIANYASAAAEKDGYKFEAFDSEFDSNKQREQPEVALQSKKYNVWMVVPFDGASICELMTVKAPEAGILTMLRSIRSAVSNSNRRPSSGLRERSPSPGDRRASRPTNRS